MQSLDEAELADIDDIQTPSSFSAQRGDPVLGDVDMTHSSHSHMEENIRSLYGGL